MRKTVKLNHAFSSPFTICFQPEDKVFFYEAMAFILTSHMLVHLLLKL